MSNAFQRDATPFETDFDDIHVMLADIRAFMRDHPDHELIPADDPGVHYTPWRVPRLGWSAFLRRPPHLVGVVLRDQDGQLEAFDEEAKYWTIPLSKLGGEKDPNLVQCFKTQAGRAALTQSLRAPV